ncbi:hypothetical protein CSEC_0255 [Criblamydia sequanensis CRIB-18]|uniref:Uncharacterized protein n=1 Tax=Candidatus Criblamydia sequanensis CRIB-18 TaxID=1437425 RepID=A0A090DVX4_9BACT|nr:hypothetical protein CSEC_0255 [Criblamydia sequanensis CRIB-18]
MLSIYQKICTKPAHSSNQSEFRKKSNEASSEIMGHSGV